jgi:two-component system, NarL family, response regulator NreC
MAPAASIPRPEAGLYSQSNCPSDPAAFKEKASLEATARDKQIRILLADDHTVVRRGLRLLLEGQPEFSVVAEASDGKQAVEAAETSRPDVVVLDVAMPNLNGIEAAQRILASNPAIAIVVLSMHSDEGYVLRALKAGAKGYLLKDAAEGDLIEAIKTVTRGKTFFSSEITKMLAEDYVREIRARGSEDSYELLTPREREILQLLAEGKSNKDIAGMLNLSLYTVETHRRNLQDKLNVHSFAELILYAVRKGVIS